MNLQDFFCVKWHQGFLEEAVSCFSRDLDLMVLMGHFQLEIFCDYTMSDHEGEYPHFPSYHLPRTLLCMF